MLRIVRQKLASAAYQLGRRHFHSHSATSAAVARSERPAEELYGAKYGAGPSRIPYDHSHQLSMRSYRPDHSSSSPPRSDRSQLVTRHSAQLLRRALSHLRSDPRQHTYANSPYSSYQNLESALHLASPLHTLSRLELHVVIHHLIRYKRRKLGPLVSRIMRHTTREGKEGRPEMRRTFAFRTLVALLRHPAKFNLLQAPAELAPRATPTDHPTVTDQAPLAPSRQLGSLLDLLETLQSVRNRRPIELYNLIVRQAVAEGLPDIAAKVYVGMVEEWIVEGRVAEGLDPDEDFHVGGGPPKSVKKVESTSGSESVAWSLRRELRTLYWKTVRSWTLPGEVLSPHDRLDLWHPRNLSLGEKLRNFPCPTPQSPPMLVPLPDDELLSIILQSLRLDPEDTSPSDFAASMRACAMLASTILNRTLPILSQSKVLQALGGTPRHPPVYPENMLEPPSKQEAWAYEAYTHIHLALLSLFFNLPIHHEWVRFISASERAKCAGLPPPPPPPPRLMYMSPPLCYRACITMVRYGLRKLQRPQIIGKILEYMKRAFGLGTSTKLFNTLLEGTTVARDNVTAGKVDDILFRKTQLWKRMNTPKPTPHLLPSEPLVIPKPEQDVQPDAESILTLISHLTATGNFDRLERTVYVIIPFLAFSKAMTPQQIQNALKNLVVKPGFSGRPRPEALPLRFYSVVLHGLEKSFRNALATRVFRIALQAEEELASSHLAQNPDADIPASDRLGIEHFTAMLLVWENELRSASIRYYRSLRVEEWPNGWSVPPEYGRLPRREAAQLMLNSTYDMARSRWQRGGNLVPDAKFFNAMIRACHIRWELKSETVLEGRRAREIQRVVGDMRAFGIPIPPLLEAKRGKIPFPEDMPGRRNSPMIQTGRPERRIAAVRERRALGKLAEMQAMGGDGVVRWPAGGTSEGWMDMGEELEVGEVLEVENARLGLEKRATA